MTLCVKMELLDTLARSECEASVGHHYGINESNVWKRDSNIHVRVPASKVQRAPSSPVILLWKGWKKCLMFGWRKPLWIFSDLECTSVWEKPLWIYSDLEWTSVWEKLLQIYKRFHKAPGTEGSSSTMAHGAN